MPRYDYLCEECGPFAETHPLSEWAEAQPCPGCGAPANRTLTLPQLGAGTGEPAAAGWQPGSGARHFGGCSCCGGGSGFRADPVPAGS